jgi:hypothetical protein
MGSVEGFQSSPREREAAARAFVAEAPSFLAAGAEALTVAERQLEGPYAAVATRTLLQSTDPAVIVRVLAAYGEPERRRLPSDQLAVLGRQQPVDDDVLAAYRQLPTASRRHELHVVLRRGTSEARAELQRLLGSASEAEAAAALRAARRWVSRELLLELSQSATSVGCEACFQLGLTGDTGGTSSLEQRGLVPGAAGARACRYLALLAYPGTIPCLAAQLTSRDAEAVALALHSVRLLGAWKVGPVLVDLIERRDLDEELLEQCGVALADLTGVPLPEDDQDVPSFYADVLSHGDADLRYWVRPASPHLRRAAEPVTLDALVDSLSDVRNPELVEAAAYQLRAMTGEDHGFEPEEDIVANIAAIDAWRAAVSARSQPAGAWFFRDQRFKEV